MTSLTFRQAAYAEHSSEVGVALVRLTHPEWGAPVLLSSDPTERITLDPLAYGTLSTWRAQDTPLVAAVPFYFVLMSINLPDKSDSGPPAVTLVFENVDRDMGNVVRSIPAARRKELRVDMAFVLSSAPNNVEEEYRNFRVLGAPIGEDRITLSVSRAPIVSEPVPCDRMTKSRFPGLFR